MVYVKINFNNKWVGLMKALSPLRPEQIEANDMLTGMLQSSHIAVTLADISQPDVPLVYVNQSFTRITGYNAKESIGRNCRYLQGPDTNPDTVTRIRNFICAGECVSVDILNYRKDGTPFLNGLELFPVYSENKKNQLYCGFQTDLSTRNEGIEEEMRGLTSKITERFYKILSL